MGDQVCPRCETTKYRNPSLKLMVNICGHAFCESCVDILLKGSGSCPDCGVLLRRSNFRIQLFEDAKVEKDIGGRTLKDYNKKEEVSTLLAKGNAALAANKFNDAVKLYSEAIAIDGKSHVLYSKRSAVYAKSENYDLALQDAEKAIQLKSDWVEGYSRKGSALAFLGRSEEAVKAYEEGLKHDPNNAQLKERIEEVRAQQLNSTQNVISMSFRDPNLMSKLQTDPRTKEYLHDPEYLKSIQELEDRMGDPRILKALNVILGVQDVSMDVDPPKSSTPKKSTFTKDSNLLLEKKEALKDFMNKAAAYFEQKEYMKCIEEAEKGIEIGRETRADFKLIAKAFKCIGDAYKELNDSYNAKTYYEKSLTEHRTPEIEILLLDAEKMIKNQERKAYIDPVKAEEELGNQLFKKGDYAEAVKHYTEAIKKNPDEAKYYSSRAVCYTKLKAFYLGLEDCDTCLSLDPNFAMGWVTKGKILHWMQQGEKASALELDSNYAAESEIDWKWRSVQTKKAEKELALDKPSFTHDTVNLVASEVLKIEKQEAERLRNENREMQTKIKELNLLISKLQLMMKKPEEEIKRLRNENREMQTKIKELNLLISKLQLMMKKPEEEIKHFKEGPETRGL